MSAMPFITLPDQDLRINLFTIAYIERMTHDPTGESGIRIVFQNGTVRTINGEPGERILQYWDSVAESLALPTATDAEPDTAPTDDTPRNFDLGNDENDDGMTNTQDNDTDDPDTSPDTP